MERIKRFGHGRVAENKLEDILDEYHLEYWKVGQENWLPGWIHKAIAYNSDDGLALIRHLPDYATTKEFISVKHAPDCDPYPSVTIEQASFDVSRRWYELGIPTMIVWLFPDGLFYGNYVQDIPVITPNTERKDTKGSHTPYYLVRKESIISIHKLIPGNW